MFNNIAQITNYISSGYTEGSRASTIKTMYKCLPCTQIVDNNRRAVFFQAYFFLRMNNFFVERTKKPEDIQWKDVTKVYFQEQGLKFESQRYCNIFRRQKGEEKEQPHVSRCAYTDNIILPDQKTLAWKGNLTGRFLKFQLGKLGQASPDMKFRHFINFYQNVEDKILLGKIITKKLFGINGFAAVVAPVEKVQRLQQIFVKSGVYRHMFLKTRIYKPEGIDAQDDGEDQCSICFNTDRNYKLACGHMYHKDCYTEWAKKGNTCPLCRKVVSKVIDMQQHKKRAPKTIQATDQFVDFIQTRPTAQVFLQSDIKRSVYAFQVVVLNTRMIRRLFG